MSGARCYGSHTSRTTGPLEGETLEARLKRAPSHRISTREACSILLPLLDALAAAHKVDIVHRDLKPANIFLAQEPDGSVIPKLLDFGIAIHPGHRSTEAGAVFGTPHYIAPEAWSGAKHCTPSSDIWAMGVVLFEMLTGHRPFNGSMMPELFWNISQAIVPDTERTMTLRARRVVTGALQREGANRWPTTTELATALRLAGASTRALGGPVNVTSHWSDDDFLEAVRARSASSIEVWFEGGEWSRSQRLLTLVSDLPLVALRFMGGAQLWSSVSTPFDAVTLESLELWDVDDDAIVEAFGPDVAFPAMESLSLQPRLTDKLSKRSLAAITEARLPALSQLSIFRCVLDDDALAVIAHWIPQLDVLSLTDCDLNDTNIETLISAIRHSSIFRLEISGTLISDELILRLLSVLPERMHLRLSRGVRSSEECAALCGRNTRLNFG